MGSFDASQLCRLSMMPQKVYHEDTKARRDDERDVTAGSRVLHSHNSELSGAIAGATVEFPGVFAFLRAFEPSW